MVTFAMAVLLMSVRAFFWLLYSTVLNKMACFPQPIRFRHMTFESTSSYPIMESSMFQGKKKKCSCSINIIKQLLSFRQGISFECIWMKKIPDLH